MTAKKNKLQMRIGGPVSAMNTAELLSEAKRVLARLEPNVIAALTDQRNQLRALVAAPRIDVDALFALAHDTRGLAGTFGYGRLGAVADALSRYISACRDAGAPPAMEVLRVLGQAMDQGFLKDDEGGALLADLSQSALALAEAKAPRVA